MSGSHDRPPAGSRDGVLHPASIAPGRGRGSASERSAGRPRWCRQRGGDRRRRAEQPSVGSVFHAERRGVLVILDRRALPSGRRAPRSGPPFSVDGPLGSGYLSLLEQKGLAPVLISEGQIAVAIRQPPDDTPAFMRGRHIVAARKGTGPKTVSWTPSPAADRTRRD